MTDDLRPRLLTPLARVALQCLAHGDLTGRWNGDWVSSCGEHVFNSHTMQRLVTLKFAAFNTERPAQATEVRLTQRGRQYLGDYE